MDFEKYRRKEQNRKVFIQGMRNAVPIGLGYFAVSFSLGIAARTAGVTPFQGFVASLLCLASAGEYAGFTMIAAQAALTELALMTLIINLRYMLMSLALSQKADPKMPFFHRLIFGVAITDELFALNISRRGVLNPWYFYGSIAVSAPLWAAGTCAGIIAGNVLPVRIVSALGVALYGMFIAIIIPPARKNKVIAGIVAVCFAASYLAENLGIFSGISSGTKTIVLTVLIAGACALLFPVTKKEEHDV